jgi:peptide/nickel transport system permease protein
MLGLLVLAALGAPLIATSRPWVARGPSGVSFPAFRSAAGLPSRWDPASSAPIVRAPVPHDPASIDLDAILRPPSRAHWLGTDGLGRDLGARIIHGARVSVLVGLASAVLALLLGLPLGGIGGYFRGWPDAVVSRLVEGVLCFPTLLLALAILASAPAWLQGLPDALRIALVLGVSGWTPAARYLRGEFLRLRETDIVVAARSMGAGHCRIVFRHLLPAAMAPVLVTTAFAIGAAILLEASLSFLGLGVRPPIATWGGLLLEARTHVEHAWWLAVFPGVAVYWAVLACNLAGEGMRDALDPRTKT